MRKYSEPLEDTANMLVTVPGGSDGPSGVLVCCENYLIYKNFGEQGDLRCPIPRRQHDLDDAERTMLFVCSATHRTKVENITTNKKGTLWGIIFFSTCFFFFFKPNKAMFLKLHWKLKTML